MALSSAFTCQTEWRWTCDLKYIFSIRENHIFSLSSIISNISAWHDNYRNEITPDDCLVMQCLTTHKQINYLLCVISIAKSNIVGYLTCPKGRVFDVPFPKAMFGGEVFYLYTLWNIWGIWPALRAGSMTCPQGRMSDLPPGQGIWPAMGAGLWPSPG